MVEIILTVVKGTVVLALVLSVVPLLTYAERKIGAYLQDRIGPEKVGLHGFIQPLADAIKFFLKEEFKPARSSKFLYYLAPFISFAFPLIALASVPLSRMLVPIQSSLSVIYVIAFSSLAVWGVVLGGWSSENKFSLLGSLRAASQMISYEVGFSLAILSILISFGSFDFVKISALQEGSILNWGIFRNPIAFIVSVVAVFAETARIPFDIPEAEAEIVAGYHTEYSGMKFAMFFMGEYSHMILASSVITLLFMGGWNIPFLSLSGGAFVRYLVEFAVFLAKVFFFIFIFILTRWTLPRFRFDQVLKIGWNALIPLGLASFLISILKIILK